MRWMIQRRRECREVDQAYRRRGEEVGMKVRRPKAKGRHGGKGTRDGGSTHLKLVRKAAKKSGVVGKLGEDRGGGRELADEKPG